MSTQLLESTDSLLIDSSNKHSGTEMNKMPAPEVSERILSTRQVTELTGLHAVTLWRRAKSGDFRLPMKITERKNGWLYSEVMAWLAQRPHANYGTKAA